MIGRAPGKLVISGAYSVLEGAPCLVAAVDRYALADAARPADFVTDEVRAAIEAGALAAAPWFDASALRERLADGTSRKLGLGSSAAILQASLAAAMTERYPTLEATREAIFAIGLAAHRKAQGGGSGVDVAASTFGGVLRADLQRDGALSVSPHPLPAGTVIEVFASPVSAVTRELLARVRALAASDPGKHRACLGAAGEGARAAIGARSTAELLGAIEAQTDALGALGAAAGAPIVTPEVEVLRPFARAEGGVFAPSGAGGGDIAFFAGHALSSPALRARAAELGLLLLALAVGAEGASASPDLPDLQRG